MYVHDNYGSLKNCLSATILQPPFWNYKDSNTFLFQQPSFWNEVAINYFNWEPVWRWRDWWKSKESYNCKFKEF